MSQLQQDDEFQENLIKLYQILGSAKAVADNLDISILDVYCVLKKHKLSIEERMQMSASSTSVFGAKGEALFKKLVPFAVEVNAVIYSNPEFDFLIGQSTVDVKASNLITHPARKGRQGEFVEWVWKLQRPWQNQYGADFYVLFGLYGKEFEDGYDCYVIPSELLSGIKGVRIRKHLKDISPCRDFLIKPEQMAAFFKKIKDSQEPKKQIFDDAFLEKERRDFFQIEVKELETLTRKVKSTVINHAKQ